MDGGRRSGRYGRFRRCTIPEVAGANTLGSIERLGKAEVEGGWRAVMVSIAAATFAGSSLFASSASAAVMLPQPMTLNQVMKAGAAGTGCS